MGNAPRKPAHHAIVFETGRAAEDPVQGHGDDRGVHILHDPLKTAAEFEQLADAGDLALGKDADHFAGADGVAGGLKRVKQLTGTLFGGDGDGPHDSGQGLDPAFFVDVFEHEETDGSIGGGKEQQSVGKGQMIADKKRPAFDGNIVAPNHLDAVQRIGEAPQRKTQEGGGHEPEQVNGGRESQTLEMTTKISGGDNFRTVVSRENTAADKPIPSQETRLATPCTAPFWSRAGRCWSIAEIGTM